MHLCNLVKKYKYLVQSVPHFITLARRTPTKHSTYYKRPLLPPFELRQPSVCVVFVNSSVTGLTIKTQKSQRRILRFHRCPRRLYTTRTRGGQRFKSRVSSRYRTIFAIKSSKWPLAAAQSTLIYVFGPRCSISSPAEDAVRAMLVILPSSTRTPALIQSIEVKTWHGDGFTVSATVIRPACTIQTKSVEISA